MNPTHRGDVPALGTGEVAVGIDIGGTKTLATAYSSRGAVATARRRTRHGADGLLDGVDEVLAELAGKVGGNGQVDVRAIGIGIPGVVSPAFGTVTNGVNVGIGAEALPLAHLVAGRTGIPVHLENDVAAATLGAAHALGVGDDVALVSLGTGLAAGMVLDGVPRTG
ncbi:MAG: ROK family protein, partial [Pauljensenia sp.]